MDSIGLGQSGQTNRFNPNLTCDPPEPSEGKNGIIKAGQLFACWALVRKALEALQGMARRARISNFPGEKAAVSRSSHWFKPHRCFGLTRSPCLL